MLKSATYPYNTINSKDFLDRNFGLRFGFNGIEKDNEIASSGNYYSFEYRLHDVRVGRFLSTDPLEKEYPWNSPYAFAENRVIDGKDLEGLEYVGSNGQPAGPLNPAYAKEKGANLEPQFKNANNSSGGYLLKEVVITANRCETDLANTQAQQAQIQQSQTIANANNVPTAPQNNTSISAYNILNYRSDMARDLQIGQGVAVGLTGEFSGLKLGQMASRFGKVVSTFEGVPYPGFTFGKSVIKYVPEGNGFMAFNRNGLSYTTDLVTSSSQEVYNSLGLGFRTSTGTINQINNSYTIYQSTMRGFYLGGKVGAQGATKGGAKQFVGFEGMTGYTLGVKLGITK